MTSQLQANKTTPLTAHHHQAAAVALPRHAQHSTTGAAGRVAPASTERLSAAPQAAQSTERGECCMSTVTPVTSH